MTAVASAAVHATHAVVQAAPSSAPAEIPASAPHPLSTALYLPKWALCHLAFAEAIAAATIEPGAIVRAAVSVPTRDYAAVLIAMAATVRRFVLTAVPTSTDLRLRKNSQVLYRRGKYTYRCWVMNDWQTDPKGLLRIKVLSRESKQSQLTCGSIVTVEPSRRHVVEALLPNGTPIGDVNGVEAIRLATGDARIAPYLCESSLGVILCGMKGRLLYEAADVVIHNGTSDLGTARDVLRPRCIYSDSYQSDIVTQRTSSSEPVETTEEPTIAVFDGSGAFLSSESRWPAASWIVVFNRTDNRDLNEQAMDRLENVFQQSDPMPFARDNPGVEYRSCMLDGPSW